MRAKKPKPLHDRLLALLREQWRAGAFDQTSLGKAIGKEQTTVGLYLRGQKAGPLDLDEAADALHHINSSLEEFLRGVEPQPISDAERIGRGHKRRETTRQHYVPVLDSRMQRMSESVDGRFKGWKVMVPDSGSDQKS